MLVRMAGGFLVIHAVEGRPFGGPRGAVKAVIGMGGGEAAPICRRLSLKRDCDELVGGEPGLLVTPRAVADNTDCFFGDTTSIAVRRVILEEDGPCPIRES